MPVVTLPNFDELLKKLHQDVTSVSNHKIDYYKLSKCKGLAPRMLDRDAFAGLFDFYYTTPPLKEPEQRDAFDVARFPHKCPRCSQPAYVGLNAVEHARSELDRTCR
jgi:hypothetical protein